MASELLKNRAFTQKIKEPKIPSIRFNLADLALDYNIESIEEELLPKEKPQELLDIQEDVRIQRQEDTMNKARPFLMDESVDFIERENFAIKGLTDEQLLDLGFDKRQIKMQKKSYKRLAEIFQKADIENNLEYLFETGNKKYPKGQVESTLRNVLNKLPEDEKGLRYIANLLGEDVEFVLDMIDEKTTLADELRTGSIMSARAEKGGNLRKEFSKVEEWMLKNGSKYSDPDKFKKATVDRFGKKNPAIKAMTSGGSNFFSNEFNQNILGYDQFDNFAKLNKTIGDNVFRTVIYNFNPKVRKAITNEFENILSGGPAKLKAEARDRIKKSKLFKQFGLTERIHGPISRLIYKEVGEELYKNLQTFRKPQIGTISFIKYLEGVVDPKYKNQFKEARNAMEVASRNEIKKAKDILGITDKVMYDHKIPSSFIDAGYADEIEYIKVTPATENFNKKIKNAQYDRPVNRLLRKFEKAKTPEAKQVIYNQILEKHNNFSKKYGGYLDDVKPSFKDGKIKFSSAAAPITKKTKFVEEFAKAGIQTGELDQKQVKKLIASVSPDKRCQGKFAEGSPPNLDFCFKSGQKAINTGKIPEGAPKRNFTKFANKAMEIGRQSGRGLRTITKFGIIPEAIILGADTAIRAGMGDTLDEAFKRASDIYRTDEAYEQADASEIRRRDPANADIILNLRNFYNEQAKLSSLEQAKEADLALAGDDFAETNIGMTEDEIEKMYAPRLQEQENNLFNASISDAEERAGLAKETEFADKKGIAYKKSFVGEILDVAAERPGIKQFADLFATGTRAEPDVGTQALSNVFRDQGVPEQKISAFEKNAEENPGTARKLLDYFKSLDAKPLPEGTVRTDRSVADEERSILFELAKTDPALAERLFGPGMTFAGDPIQQTDLQDEMNLDRGIFALGGRIGFKDGPKNPGRRTFIKGMGILAALPFVGKLIKPAAKPIIQKLSNTTTVMPDWFPKFVDNFLAKGVGKKIDADMMQYKVDELPGVTLTKVDDGRIRVEGKNAYGEPYEIEYTPPGYELIDETTGKAVKTPGEFQASDTRFRQTGPELDDVDVDYDTVKDIEDIVGGDSTKLEGFAKGTGKTKYTKGQKAVDEAEARSEYSQQERADFDQGPEIDPTDYYYED